MNWIQQTVAEFGQTLGIPALALDPDNWLDLALESGELISIQYLAELAVKEVLVSRSKPLTYNRPDQLRRALRLVDFRLPSAWPVQAALSDDALIFNMRIPERSFVLTALEQAIAQLGEMHKRVE
jgi:type III secretion system chaperone SycN